jgi:hypothetical protein
VLSEIRKLSTNLTSGLYSGHTNFEGAATTCNNSDATTISYNQLRIITSACNRAATGCNYLQSLPRGYNHLRMITSDLQLHIIIMT